MGRQCRARLFAAFCRKNDVYRFIGWRCLVADGSMASPAAEIIAFSAHISLPWLYRISGELSYMIAMCCERSLYAYQYIFTTPTLRPPRDSYAMTTRKYRAGSR